MEQPVRNPVLQEELRQRDKRKKLAHAEAETHILATQAIKTEETEERHTHTQRKSLVKASEGHFSFPQHILISLWEDAIYF